MPDYVSQASSPPSETDVRPTPRLVDERERPLPPWKAFPDLPRFSIGWRSRRAESYLMQWHSWYAGLGEDARREYRRHHRAPWPLWTGFYATLSRRTGAFAFGLAVTGVVFTLLALSRGMTYPLGRRVPLD